MGKHRFTRLTMAQTWGKPPPSPFIVYYVLGHMTITQMSFCPKNAKWESRNSHNSNSHDFGAHNFACIPSIKMRNGVEHTNITF